MFGKNFFLCLLIMLCIICLCVVMFTTYYTPSTSIILTNHFPYEILHEKIKYIYMVKTYLVENIMTFASDYFSHWATMVRTYDDHHILFSSARTGNLYVYYITNDKIYNKHGKIFIRHCDIYPKWTITKIFKPSSENIKVSEYMNTLSDLINNMKYQYWSYNCQFVTTYIIQRFSLDPVDIPIRYGELRHRLFWEYLNGRNIMK